MNIIGDRTTAARESVRTLQPSRRAAVLTDKRGRTFVQSRLKTSSLISSCIAQQSSMPTRLQDVFFTLEEMQNAYS